MSTQPVSNHSRPAAIWQILLAVLALDILSVSIHYLISVLFPEQQSNEPVFFGIFAMVSAITVTSVTRLALGRMSGSQFAIISIGTLAADGFVWLFYLFASSLIYMVASYIGLDSIAYVVSMFAATILYWSTVVLSIGVAFHRRLPLSCLPIQCLAGILGKVAIIAAIWPQIWAQEAPPVYLLHIAGFTATLITYTTLGLQLRYYAPIILNLQSLEPYDLDTINQRYESI